MAKSRHYRRRPVRHISKDNSAKQRRIIRGILITSAVILLIIFFFGDHGLYQLYRVRSEREQIKREIEHLRTERIRLEGKKQQLENDFEYIERLARERYRMAKKGEKVFKVIDTTQQKRGKG
ncbi:MAG: septum formation initiator family protein [Candidatus Marinimicrobia bacterium]|nr:septum formation initiator family protein [Candidatus Neomarinimicrobiota bacterium]